MWPTQHSLVHRQHDGEGVGEVRGYGEEVASLVESFLDHPELLVVQVEDGLLEVSHPSMDELGATTAGTTGEIILLH